LILSILICSVDNRIEKHLIPLFDKINDQINKLEDPSIVEVLVFTDNRRRSIGYKRQSLLDIANGKYVCWIDDDDSIEDNYVSKLVLGCKSNCDVVTFKQHVIINGSNSYTLIFDIEQKENEEAKQPYFKRPPWHVCPIKREIAVLAKFPDLMYGEDWLWMSQIINKLSTAYHIDEYLCTYIYDDNITLAK